jgi:hypothetical protein
MKPLLAVIGVAGGIGVLAHFAPETPSHPATAAPAAAPAAVAPAKLGETCSRSNGIKHCVRVEKNYTATIDSDQHGNINFMRHVFPDVKQNSAEATLVTGFSLVALHPNLMRTKAERVAVMNALLEKVNTGNSLRFGDFDLTADRSEQGVYRFEAKRYRRATAKSRTL